MSKKANKQYVFRKAGMSVMLISLGLTIIGSLLWINIGIFPLEWNLILTSLASIFTISSIVLLLFAILLFRLNREYKHRISEE